MQTERLTVTGMTCGSCADAVTRALRAAAGVVDVDVSMDAGEATIRFDERTTSIDQLASAIERAGYGAGSSRDDPAPQRKGCCCG